MANAKAPTAKQLKAGPVVNLHRAGWTNHSVDLHGFDYPIRFDGNDAAVVLVAHYDEWIGDERARVLGIVVDKPAPAKKKPAAKKKAAAKSKKK